MTIQATHYMHSEGYCRTCGHPLNIAGMCYVCTADVLMTPGENRMADETPEIFYGPYDGHFYSFDDLAFVREKLIAPGENATPDELRAYIARLEGHAIKLGEICIEYDSNAYNNQWGGEP